MYEFTAVQLGRLDGPGDRRRFNAFASPDHRSQTATKQQRKKEQQQTATKPQQQRKMIVKLLPHQAKIMYDVYVEFLRKMAGQSNEATMKRKENNK